MLSLEADIVSEYQHQRVNSVPARYLHGLSWFRIRLDEAKIVGQRLLRSIGADEYNLEGNVVSPDALIEGLPILRTGCRSDY
jgi:hypothetical protein